MIHHKSELPPPRLHEPVGDELRDSQAPVRSQSVLNLLQPPPIAIATFPPRLSLSSSPDTPHPPAPARTRPTEVIIHVLGFLDVQAVRCFYQTARRFRDAVIFVLPRSLNQASGRYTALYDQHRPLVEELRRLGRIPAQPDPGWIERRQQIQDEIERLGDKMDAVLQAWDLGIDIWQTQGLTPAPPSLDRPEDFRELSGPHSLAMAAPGQPSIA
ncbi:MAG: F-box protein [Pseudomonadota bacterium]